MKQIVRCLYILLPLAFGLAAGCKKENIFAEGNYQDAVYFAHSSYDQSIDSLSFTFISQPDSVKLDTIWLPVRIAGKTATRDRQITMTVVDTATTAVAGTHYKLLDYHMPKDSFVTNLGIVLYRTADLQDTAVQLTVQLQPNSDFPVLMKDTTSANGRLVTDNVYHIRFSDQLIKPTNWDSFLVYIFGTYSKVKYRFIIDVTGRTDFPISGAGALAYAQLLYYQGIVKTALGDDEAKNGTMYDEHGNPVTIP